MINVYRRLWRCNPLINPLVSLPCTTVNFKCFVCFPSKSPLWPDKIRATRYPHQFMCQTDSVIPAKHYIYVSDTADYPPLRHSADLFDDKGLVSVASPTLLFVCCTTGRTPGGKRTTFAFKSLGAMPALVVQTPPDITRILCSPLTHTPWHLCAVFRNT